MAELPEGIIEGDLQHISHHNTLHALVERLDDQPGTGPFPFTAAGYKTGTLAARPTADATNEEFYYYAYDTQQLFISYAGAWVDLTPFLRVAPTVLQTTDQVRIGSLAVANSAASTGTPGATVRKIEVFDAAGVSLGFIPVYAAIT